MAGLCCIIIPSTTTHSSCKAILPNSCISPVNELTPDSYLICVTIGPTFFSAAIYLCLARIVVAYGEEYSRFKPRTYTLTFITCDIFSLVLQAVGGALADLAQTKAQGDVGVHIMVAGLSFQVASLFLFA